MRRIYFRFPRRGKVPKHPFRWFGKIFRRLKGSMFGPLYWGIAHRYDTPGLLFQRKSAVLGLALLLRSRIRFGEAYGFMFQSMDSVRYFEFGTIWEFLSTGGGTISRYLDVSSPRLFPLILLDEFPIPIADIVNPDGKDLETTMAVMGAAGLSDRCRFHGKTIDDLDFSPGTFDLVTSISVIEHIPDGGDRKAVERIWNLLRPGGRLYLSVPCAREPFEEFMDLNEYGILAPDEQGFVFGWTCYDATLVRDRIFAVTGEPARFAVFGEKVAGSFFRNRAEKLGNPDYPFWKEPYMMGREYGHFRSIEELPGIGIIVMEFLKR